MVMRFKFSKAFLAFGINVAQFFVLALFFGGLVTYFSILGAYNFWQALLLMSLVVMFLAIFLEKNDEND